MMARGERSVADSPEKPRVPAGTPDGRGPDGGYAMQIVAAGVVIVAVPFVIVAALKVPMIVSPLSAI